MSAELLVAIISVLVVIVVSIATKVKRAVHGVMVEVEYYKGTFIDFDRTYENCNEECSVSLLSWICYNLSCRISLSDKV
jgi:hypothetical protein